MANNDNGGSGGRFSRGMASGLIATIAWFVVLVTYCTFRAFGIEDPLLGQAFLLLTGAWVGNLTLAQGKKAAHVEEKVDRLQSELRAKNERRRNGSSDEDGE